LSLAVEIIISYGEGKNPYELNSHTADCDEDIWEDRESGILLSEDEIAERDCHACALDWGMWRKLIKKCDEAWYGFWAYELMSLNSDLELFGEGQQLSAYDYEALKTVRAEIARRKAYWEWKRGQPD